MIKVGHYIIEENDFGWAIVDSDGIIVAECQSFGDAVRVASKLVVDSGVNKDYSTNQSPDGPGF